MQFEFLTKEDLTVFKSDLVNEINSLFKKADTKPVIDTVRTNEARQILKCSKGKLHKLLSTGKLPHTKIFGTIYIKRSDISNLIENQTV